MKPKQKRLLFLLLLPLGGLVAYALWPHSPARASDAREHKVICYQDSMHPWVKSNHAGKCTVCGMDLTPIYEGQTGLGVNPSLVALNSNHITVLNVQTEAVQRRALGRTLRVAGTLDANEARKAVVSAPARGRIDDVAFGYAGAEVEKGQRLITFFSPDLLALRRILMLGNYASQDTNMADMKNLPVDRNTANLVAPLSGVVLERDVYNGQYVNEGDRLLTIADASVLWFRFDVYEQQMPWFDLGQRIDVSVAALPGRVFPAEVCFIEPSLNDATRTVKIRAEIKNPIVGTNGHPRRLLRFGMYAEARVRAGPLDVLTVPRTAILFPGASAYAYVDRGGGVFERRRVELGRQGDQLWEVLQGLEEGERVVTTGNVLIDAQAQFNQSEPMEEHGVPAVATAGEPAEDDLLTSSADLPSATPAAEGDASAAHKEGLSAAQEKTLKEFLTVADGISGALAADKLDQLKAQLAGLPKAAESLEKEFGGAHAWHALCQRIEATARWPVPADLAAARKSFLPFSTNVVELVQQLRAQGQALGALKVYHCPMAPKPGLWFQAKGPLRNPYYGAEMLTCGTEVKAPTAPPRAAPVEEHAPLQVSTSHAPSAGDPEAGPALTNAPDKRAEVGATVLPDLSSYDAVANGQWRSAEIQFKRRGLLAAANAARAADTNSPAAEPHQTMPAPGGHAGGGTNAASIPMPSPRERNEIEGFIAVVHGMGQGLASDNLEHYNRQLIKLPGVCAALTLHFRADHPWGKLVDQTVAMSTQPQAKDLEQARRQFLRLSTAAVEWVKRLRKDAPGFNAVKIYHCPMAPKPGLWVQAKGPLSNPFYGNKMLNCGEEITQ